VTAETTPLVGRDRPLAELDAVLAEARQGRGRLVLLTGEAGIGKTRLAEELVRRADGFAHHWAWCRSDQSMGSLRTWSTVLRALTATHPAVAELAERTPLLRSLVAGTGTGEVHPEAGRGALAQDVAEALRLAADRPRLVVLDDAHDAEASTLRLLLDISPELRALPVVVVATARDTGWEGREELRADLLRQGTRVALAPLTAEEVRDLVPDADDRLVARTGGNPLLVTELARAAEEVPASLRTLVGARLAAVPPRTRQVLEAAAVLGPRFRLDVLAEVASTPLDELEPHLVPDLVVVSSAGDARFTHELLRDAAYEEVADKQTWHARAGAVLDVLLERGRMVAPAEVAAHLLRAGSAHTDAAVRRCLDAAVQAERLQAFEDAVHWYDQVLDRLEDPARHADVLMRRARARRGYGDREGARDDLLLAGSLAQQANRPDLLAHAALGLGSGPGGFEVDQGDAAQLDLLQAALAALAPEDLELRAFVTARLAVARARLDPPYLLEATAREAVELARSSGSPAALGVALAALCDTVAGPDDVAERLDHATEVVELALLAGDGDLELLGRRLRLMALVEQGRREESERELRAYELRAHEVRHPLYLWYPPLWRSMWAIAEGRYDDSEALLDEASHLAAGSPNGELLTTVGRWFVFVGRGDLEGLRRTHEALDLTGLVDLWVHITRALVAAELGDLPAARQHFELVAHRLDEIPRDGEWLATMAQVAELVDALGGHPAAATVTTMLEPYAELWAVEGNGAAVHGPVHFSLALIHPDPVAREQHRARAVELLRGVGAVARAALLTADAAPVETGPAALVREGDVWALTWHGRETRVKDSKGVRDLATLLASPGTEIPALDLYGGVTEHDTGEVLDATAREAYKRRLRELEDADSLSEAEATERALLLEQLAGAYGLGGRVRRTGSSSEKARSAVTARVRDAVRRITAHDPDLGRHLDRSVRTGTFCSYAPETPVAWRLTP
jgi:tetratricopeptide (TPR) repeat protein